jgi:hypothetical protein
MMFLGLTISASLLAADASKILLSGASVSVENAQATGSARAVVGEMTATADVIAFDKEKNVLRCEGTVTIRVSGNVVTAHDCAIELAPGEKKLFFLSQQTIRPGQPTQFPLEPSDLIGPRSDRENLLQDFKARTENKKASNHVPEPTKP